jgi:hypothetical protein
MKQATSPAAIRLMKMWGGSLVKATGATNSAGRSRRAVGPIPTKCMLPRSPAAHVLRDSALVRVRAVKRGPNLSHPEDDLLGCPSRPSPPVERPLGHQALRAVGAGWSGSCTAAWPVGSPTRSRSPGRPPNRQPDRGERGMPGGATPGVLATWIARGPVVPVGQGCREVKRMGRPGWSADRSGRRRRRHQPAGEFGCMP